MHCNSQQRPIPPSMISAGDYDLLTTAKALKMLDACGCDIIVASWTLPWPVPLAVFSSADRLHHTSLPPGSNLPLALSLSQPSCLSALDMDSDLKERHLFRATAHMAYLRNGTHQWRTGLTGGLLVYALSHPGHECRALPLRNQTNLLLLIVVVDDFEIAKRATLLFSRENDFFELDDRNNL